jgi:hypothetical protein
MHRSPFRRWLKIRLSVVHQTGISSFHLMLIAFEEATPCSFTPELLLLPLRAYLP